MSSLTSPPQPDIGRQFHHLAGEALRGFAVSGPANDQEMDAGPAVLASLTAEAFPDATNDAVGALSRWLGGLRTPARGIGLCGGLAGYVAGTQAARSWLPRIEHLASSLHTTLANDTAVNWRRRPLAWQDYDVPSGAAGVILAAGTGGDVALPLGAVRHLVRLCARDDLRGLRMSAHPDDERIGWNFNRINTGLAHGVGAVAAALCAAVNRGGASREAAGTRRALRRACNWLVAESFEDTRGLRTWLPAGREGMEPPRGAQSRQGWCYGTPGLAWTLAECGRALGDAQLRDFGFEAMRSFCAVFDEAFYIDRNGVDDALGICHGAAGMLAIADAFALHVRLPEAEVLKQRLLAYLLDRVDEVHDLARENMNLQTGAAGILAVLLTVAGGRRDWLCQLALR